MGQDVTTAPTHHKPSRAVPQHPLCPPRRDPLPGHCYQSAELEINILSLITGTVVRNLFLICPVQHLNYAGSKLLLGPVLRFRKGVLQRARPLPLRQE